MDKSRLQDFAQQVLGHVSGAMTAGLAYVGVKTGLFDAMAGRGPLTADAVVRASGLHARYVHEWLAGMVAGGYLEYDPGADTYALPEEHAHFLASAGSDHYMGGVLHAAPCFLSQAPRIVQAFREGGGVPYTDFGPEAVRLTELSSSGLYAHRLADDWLPMLPGTVEALRGGGRVLDFGCGVGHAALAIARAFPDASVVGVDLDAHSIERAREAARAEGLADRVVFHVQPVEALAADARFDLILAFDAIHDVDAPLETLRALRGRLTPRGTLFQMELRAADRLEDNINPLAAMYYGFSLFH